MGKYNDSPNGSDNLAMRPSHWRVCIAPMMEYSDLHSRYLWRLMSKHTRLYTEMVVTGAIIHGDRRRFLRFNPPEHPLALQLGGSDAQELAECAKIAEDWGYDEVNLNCGCPSDRVQKGKIGAVLMKEPDLVADCVAAMASACSIPITVKHRIGVDDADSYAHMEGFVRSIRAAGCKTFIVHARKAWLKGLSPKQNREVPPLNYGDVIKLKETFSDLNIVINGGITSIDQCQTLLGKVDGVMIGREAYSNPYLINDVDEHLFDEKRADVPSRIAIVEAYADYCQMQMKNEGIRLHHMSRHVLGMFSGQANGRLFRRHLSDHACKPDASYRTLLDALAYLT